MTEHTKKRLMVGIDTGTNTGFAVYNLTDHIIERIETLMIHEAILALINYSNDKNVEIVKVRVEDARKARFGHKTDGLKLKGVGSVCRDAKIMEDFLTDYNIPFEMVRPNKAITKWSPEAFKSSFGWSLKTTSHSRDAAMLVIR